MADAEVDFSEDGSVTDDEHDPWDDPGIELYVEHPSICQSCGEEIEPDTHAGDMGFRYCDDCWVAARKHQDNNCCITEITHTIDGSLMIWTGMPDMAEPQCHMHDLPIWHYHADKAHYARFPYRALLEQLDLMYRKSQDKSKRVSFDCFICHQKHEVLEENNE